MIVVGIVLALWSTTGAMTTYMTALNIAYKRDETRPFVRRRLLALAMVACIGLAFLLVAVLLLFGPTIEHYLGQTLGVESMLGYRLVGGAVADPDRRTPCSIRDAALPGPEP